MLQNDHSIDAIKERVQRRGGLWGCRSLRLALARRDASGSAYVSSVAFSEALAEYGVRGVPAAAVAEAFSGMPVLKATAAQTCATPTISIVSAMRDVMGAQLGAEHLGLLSSVYRQLVLRLCRPPAAAPTLRALFTHLDIRAHLDCLAGRVRGEDALACFFFLWGVPLEAPVSQDLFLQFHADFLVRYSADDFSRTFPALWGLSSADCTAGMAAAPTLPTRSESDALFTEMDINGNNILSLAELDLAIVRRLPQYNYKPLIFRAYKLADANRSGWLSRGEFHRFMVLLTHLLRMATAFQRIDVDRSRSITLDELTAHRDALGLGRLSNVQLREVFMEMDRNRGGKVLFDEFCTFMLARYPPPTLTEGARR